MDENRTLIVEVKNRNNKRIIRRDWVAAGGFAFSSRFLGGEVADIIFDKIIFCSIIKKNLLYSYMIR